MALLLGEVLEKRGAGLLTRLCCDCAAVVDIALAVVMMLRVGGSGFLRVRMVLVVLYEAEEGYSLAHYDGGNMVHRPLDQVPSTVVPLARLLTVIRRLRTYARGIREAPAVAVLPR